MIPHVGGRILRDDFGVDGDEELSIVKAGVTPEQVRKYNLLLCIPPSVCRVIFRWFVESERRRRQSHTSWIYAHAAGHAERSGQGYPVGS